MLCVRISAADHTHVLRRTCLGFAGEKVGEIMGNVCVGEDQVREKQTEKTDAVAGASDLNWGGAYAPNYAVPVMNGLNLPSNNAAPVINIRGMDCPDRGEKSNQISDPPNMTRNSNNPSILEYSAGDGGTGGMHSNTRNQQYAQNHTAYGGQHGNQHGGYNQYGHNQYGTTGGYGEGGYGQTQQQYGQAQQQYGQHTDQGYGQRTQQYGHQNNHGYGNNYQSNDQNYGRRNSYESHSHENSYGSNRPTGGFNHAQMSPHNAANGPLGTNYDQARYNSYDMGWKQQQGGILGQAGNIVSALSGGNKKGGHSGGGGAGNLLTAVTGGAGGALLTNALQHAAGTFFGKKGEIAVNALTRDGDDGDEDARSYNEEDEDQHAPAEEIEYGYRHQSDTD